MTDTTYDFPPPGCYQDGANWNQTEMDTFVIGLARSYGWDNAEEPDEEWLSELADGAIDYLNTLETREGHHWAFENGDFGLWTEGE